MKKYIYLLIFFLYVIVSVYSQTNNGMQAPDIIPKSPEVKGLERYGEYPVSEYTGIPSINIPLHTIKLRDIEFPISLDYHATGIQVNQEATWAGLGWNLMAGGCISTMPVGKIDFADGASLLSDEWNKILNYTPPYLFPVGGPRLFPEDGFRRWGKYNPLCQGDNHDPDKVPISDKMINEALYGVGGRDIYNISILGTSFKVSIHPVDGRIIYNGEKNKYKIQNARDNRGLWTITDEKGYMYLFSEVESSRPNNSIWYLSQIYHPGIEGPLLKINYTSATVTSLPNISESIISHAMSAADLDFTNGSIDRTVTGGNANTCTQLYISSIVGPLDSIVFTRKSRTDLRGASALDQIIIYDRGTNKEIKRYKFEHDYFTGVYNGANPSELDYVTKRLRLVKLHEQNGTQVKGSYQFTYNETPLPYKTSFAQDLWGFYNGQDNKTDLRIAASPIAEASLYGNNRTLIPDPLYHYLNGASTGVEIPQRLFMSRLADRRVSKDLITAGMLKSITYPTGGKTEFEFEPHILNNCSYPFVDGPSAGITYNSHILKNNGNSVFNTKPQYMIIENKKETKARIKVEIYGKDYYFDQMRSFRAVLSMNPGTSTARSISYPNLTEDQRSKFNQTKSFTVEEDVVLPVGKIYFSIGVPEGIPDPGKWTGDIRNGVRAMLTYPNFSDIDRSHEFESSGGGIRIKSIRNYTGGGAVSSIRSYSYPSGGTLIHPLRFANISRKMFPKPYDMYRPVFPSIEARQYAQFTSYNMYNYSTSGCDAVVGYGSTEMETVSPLNTANTGKVVSKFINVPSKLYTHLLPIPFFSPVERQYANGKLSQRIVLDAKGDTLSMERNTYSMDNLEYNYINILAFDNFIGPRDKIIQLDSYGGSSMPSLCNEMNPYMYKNSHDIIVYPTNSYNVHLTKHDETMYYGDKRVSKSIAYEYDPLNYQQKKVTETAGDKQRMTEYKYALNYNPVISLPNQAWYPGI